MLAAQGQHEAKTHRIGVLTDNATHRLFAEGFRGSLRDLGYVEGRNLAIDWRSTEGRSAPLGDLASELVRSQVDLIVATYPVRNAYRAVQTAAKEKGAETFGIANGGKALVNTSAPTNVYFAYPHSDYQIEVFDPHPGRARGLVSSGKIRPVG